MQNRTIFSLFLFLTVLTASWTQNSLSLEQTALVTGSVFEVVIEKTAEGTLEYEEELPLHLLPFQYRNDKYESIGTAFAVGDNLFLSAAHVFTPEFRTLRENISLRDGEGTVYPVDMVYKYDNNRDYILFSVKGMSGNSSLKINEKAGINEYVFAVGNAYGEGIIFRNGLLTSKTPERENGAWRWLRFSAAASPGNSGGPLLDKNGEVIGIVTAKSENENLNYALPVTEVGPLTASEGNLHINMVYGIPNINYKYRKIFDRPVALPRKFSDLKEELGDYQEEVVRKSIRGLVDDRRDELFPGDPGAAEMLTITQGTLFPYIINEKDDSTWQMSKPSEISSADFGDGGYLQTGKIWGDTLWQLELPAGESVEDLFSDPENLMAHFLAGYKVTRKVGSADVRITSYGPPARAEWQEDSWGRRWLMTEWDLPFADCKTILFALPTPSGAVGIHNIVSTSNAYAYEKDYGVMTDYIYTSYSASFSQWREFLSLTGMIPGMLKDFDFDYTAGDSARIGNPSFNMVYDGSLIGVSDASRMYMVSGFYKSMDKVSLDISRVFLYESGGSSNYFALEKKFRPYDPFDTDEMEKWKNLADGKYPYNSDPIISKGNTYVYEVRNIGSEDYNDPGLNYLWTTMLSRGGELKDNDMLSFFSKVRSGFSLSSREKEGAVYGTDLNFDEETLSLIDGMNIFQALSMDRDDIIGRFVASGLDLDSRNGEGMTPLMAALQMEKNDSARRLLDGGSRVNISDKNGNTPLHLALRFMPEDFALTLLDKGADPAARDRDGYTPLMDAALREFGKAGLRIMNTGVPLDTVNSYGRSALYYAVYKGMDELAVELASRGAPVSFDEEISYSLLMAAIEKCSAETARYLMDKGAETDIVSKNGWTTLLSALRYDKDEIAADLIRKSRDINYGNNNGWTPLMMAARNSTLANVKLLVEKGADLHALTNDGENALMLSFYNDEDKEIADYLLDLGLGTDCVDETGWTTLMSALRYGTPEQGKRVFESTRNFGGVTDNGWTPLMFALRYGYADLVRPLTEKGNPVESSSKDGTTPLLLAVRYQDLDIVKYLAGKGADLFAVDEDNYNGVMKAARGGREINALYLLDQGVPCDLTGNTGWTPLMLSLRYCTTKLSTAILEKNVPLGRSRTENGWNDLLLAMRYASPEVCNLMLDGNPDLTVTNNSAYTPLHFAAQYRKEVVARMIEMGAPLDVQNEDGDTPLHLAASKNVEQSVRLLLEAGASQDIRNSDGLTAKNMVGSGNQILKALFD